LFGGSALTGVHPYMGNEIPNLTGSCFYRFCQGWRISTSGKRGFSLYQDKNWL